eukprot:7693419-Karenia_brevis.AAC.1
MEALRAPVTPKSKSSRIQKSEVREISDEELQEIDDADAGAEEGQPSWAKKLGEIVDHDDCFAVGFQN